jgi:hypothetical protein
VVSRAGARCQAFVLVRLPGPPSEPDVPVSEHPASNWLMERSRDQLSDRPFGDGTPGVGWLPREEVPADHGPGGVPHR